MNLDHIAEQLRPLAVPIESLTPDPHNARLHPEANREALRHSLKTFGQYLPFVVQQSGMVVRVGNCRLGLAKELGWTHVAALIRDDADEVAKLIALLDNRSGEIGEWNPKQLEATLGELVAWNPVAIESIGWTKTELRALVEPSWDPKADPGSTGAGGATPPPETSHVRMVQLFFNDQTHPEFLAMADRLASELGTQNITDTCMEVMRAHYRAHFPAKE